MVRVRARVSGADFFAKHFRDLAKTSELQNIVLKHGLEGQRLSKIYAPVDTGFLKRSIRLYQSSDKFKVSWISEAEYAIYQEVLYTPHIRPAFYKVESNFLREVGDFIDGK